jgi:hypothetical protein
MSNYTKLTAYDTKDSLTTGDPLKRVKGTELDDEFDAISTAIATKANLASPEFTGTPTVPTASVGTNTTQAASTAFVQAALSAIYPVGSIYTNATSAVNPGTLLGFGTWTAFAAGRVMVGFNSSNALFDTAEETGGSADAIVVSHDHTFSATTGNTDLSHTHQYGSAGNWGSGSANAFDARNSGSFTSGAASANMNHSHTVSGTTAATGSSGTNANYQPYITVYMWKRTA